MVVDPRLLGSLRWRLVGPHRGGRVVAVAGDPTDPHDLLLRRLRRRRLEDDRRRLYLGQRLRRLLQDRGRRRDRGRAVRPERDLRRHGRGVHPRQRLARRRRLPVHRRRPHLDATSACATRATSAACASIRTIPTSSTSRRSATPGGRTTSAASSARATAGATWEQVLFKSERAGRDRPRDGPAQPARPLRRDLAGAALPRAGWSAAATNRRPLEVDRRRRHLDRDHAQRPACRRACSGEIGVAVSPADGRAASGRWSRPRTARCSAPTTAARPGSASARKPALRGASLVLHARLRRPADADTVWVAELLAVEVDRRRHDLRARCRRRTATTTTSGSTRRNPRRMIEGNDGGACVSFNGGAVLVDDLQPADRAVLPRHDRRPAAPTASTARSRTTAAISVPSQSHRRRDHRATTGSSRAAARAATSRSSPTTRTSSSAGADRQRPGHGDDSSTTTTARGQDAQHHASGRRLYGWGVGAGEHSSTASSGPSRSSSRRTTRTSSTSPATASSARPTRGTSWEVVSPDLTRNDPAKLRSVRRADHPRQHRRRGLLHDLRARRVAARARRALGRHRRRAGPPLARSAARPGSSVDAARALPSGR